VVCNVNEGDLLNCWDDVSLESFKQTKIISLALDTHMKFRLVGTVKRLNVKHRTSNIDGFVKSLKSSFGVIPVKAGIQYFQIVQDTCLRRHDGILAFLRVCQY
jgi:hypothetical protein